MTKAEVFQELIRKVLHQECELEEINNDVPTEGGNQQGEKAQDRAVDN